MSDSYFDSDTELYSGKRSSQYNEFVVNDIESLDLYQSIVSGYYKFNFKIGCLNINSVIKKNRLGQRVDEQKYVWNVFFSRSSTALFHRARIHIQDWADNRLVDLYNRLCLLNRINEPTRVTKTYKSLIDVLLISHAECYATSGSLHLGLINYDLNFTMRRNKAKGQSRARSSVGE